MNKPKPEQSSNLSKVVKKLSLSAFVVMTFAAYAMHKPSSSADGSLGVSAPTPSAVVPPQVFTPTSPVVGPTASAPEATVTKQVDPPTPTAEASATTPPTAQAVIPTTTSGYKDGTYTGPEVDAIYGLVQVQTVIQNGKIVNVQFLQFPNDRRTSQRINNYAVPTLQQEAIQAQSANVDLITGATLTSEAFQMSLQAALSQAKGAA
jgi:uncharacterized protein with FMN-binding domain